MPGKVTRLEPGTPARPLLQVAMRRLDLSGTQVLGPMDLSVAQGETVALVGPSGIGKSTLLRAICGLTTDYVGQIDAPPGIAIIFQEPTLLPWRTLSQNLRVTVRIDAAESLRWLDAVGLSGREGDFPGQLSLGQQRRLALARAFATRPALLLMDEPFVSLDPDLVDEMMALFAQLRAETQTTTLFVTHVEDEARRLASRIVTLGGPPARITGDAQNKGAYFQLSASGVTSSRS